MKGNLRKPVLKKSAAFLMTFVFLSLTVLPVQAKTTIKLVRIEAVYDNYDEKNGDKDDIPKADTGDPIDTSKLVVTATYRINEDGATYEQEKVLNPSQYELSTDTVLKGLRTVEVTYTYKGKEKKDTFKLRGIGELDEPEFMEDKKGRWYMIDTNGSMVKDSLIKVNGKTYLFDENGYMVDGWHLYKNRWYYFDEYDFAAEKGWKEIDSTVYYFDDDCAMVTNYWCYHNGKWYYFGGSGIRSKGWIYTDSNWYFMNDDYTMHTGWKEEKGKWYYLDASGEMITGWKQIKDTWYYFNNNGVMAANTFIDDYYVDSNGAWIPDWQSR